LEAAPIWDAARFDREQNTVLHRGEGNGREERRDAQCPVVPTGVCAMSPSLHYGVILADPPWTFATYSHKGKGRSAEAHYDCMSLADIKALPVADWAAPDCALFLWAIDPSLPQAFEVIEAWGFTYKTVAFTWVKTTKGGAGFPIGCGYWTRANPEQCLLATRGRPQRLLRSVQQLILAPRREHSRKPDEVYARIEALVAGRYLELFAREQRTGWDSWGNEVETGPAERRWGSNSYPSAFRSQQQLFQSETLP
jgi:N6-adenosine-specific RNA methylase IME4